MFVLIMSLSDNVSDREFLNTIYKDYNKLIRGVAFNIVKNESDMEDVEHNVVIKLIKNVKILRDLTKYQLLSYLKRVTTTTAIDFLRKKNHEVPQEDIYFEKVKNIDNKVDTTFISVSDKEAFSNAFKKLDEKSRGVLYEKYIIEISYKKLAKKYKVKENNMRVIVARARAKLKMLLIEEDN